MYSHTDNPSLGFCWQDFSLGELLVSSSWYMDLPIGVESPGYPNSSAMKFCQVVLLAGKKINRVEPGTSLGAPRLSWCWARGEWEKEDGDKEMRHHSIRISLQRFAASLETVHDLHINSRTADFSLWSWEVARVYAAVSLCPLCSKTNDGRPHIHCLTLFKLPSDITTTVTSPEKWHHQKSDITRKVISPQRWNHHNNNNHYQTPNISIITERNISNTDEGRALLVAST